MASLRAAVAAVSSVRVRLGPGGGSWYTARVLSGLEQELLKRLYPQPSPPMVDDPNGGSLAPKIPDENDPAFKANEEGWYFDLVLATVAASLGHEVVEVPTPWPDVTLENHRSLEVRRQAEAFMAEARPLLARLRWAQLRYAYDAAITGEAHEREPSAEPSGSLEAAVKN